MSIDKIIELANKHGYTGGDTELRLAIQAYANSERKSLESRIDELNNAGVAWEDYVRPRVLQLTKELAQLSNPQEEKHA